MQSVFNPTFKLFSSISLIIAYGYGAFLIINQDLTVGELITFSLLLTQFSLPMMQLGNQIAFFAQSKVSAERVSEVLNAVPEIQDRVDAKDIITFDEIKFNDISFKYPGTDFEILNGFDLTIKNSKSLGIVGKTGSGKTTLIRQLLRRYPVTDDAIYVDGVSINDIKKSSED